MTGSGFRSICFRKFGAKHWQGLSFVAELEEEEGSKYELQEV